LLVSAESVYVLLQYAAAAALLWLIIRREREYHFVPATQPFSCWLSHYYFGCVHSYRMTIDSVRWSCVSAQDIDRWNKIGGENMNQSVYKSQPW
jgi:hypothetical protein